MLCDHLPTSRSITAFSSNTADDLGLALMNLDLHGCVGITAANMLCDCGLVLPATFLISRNDAGNLVFDAIEVELLATVEIGRISLAGAAKHPFITEAFARMRTDQFATHEHVVFDYDHLSQCRPEALETALARSVRRWRRRETPKGQR